LEKSSGSGVEGRAEDFAGFLPDCFLLLAADADVFGFRTIEFSNTIKPSIEEHFLCYFNKENAEF